MLWWLVPIKINRLKRQIPIATFTIIGICVFIYIIEAFYLFTNIKFFNFLMESLSFKTNSAAWYTWLTSMFMHSPNPLHIVGNMYYLYLFGSHIENTLGSKKYVAVYLLSGLVGALLYGLIAQAGGYANIGAVGASGAISGIMGIAMVRYKQNRVTFGYFVFILFFVKWGTFSINAFGVILFYFAMQLFYGVYESLIGVTSGIAYWGHLGGLLVGLLVVKSMKLEEDADAEHLAEDAAKEGRLGNFEAAAKIYEKLILEEPSNSSYQYKSGKMWALSGDSKKASVRLMKSINLYLEKGKKEESSQVYEDYMKFCPECELDDETLYKIAILCESKHKFQAALDTFRKILNDYPKSQKKEIISFRLGQLLLKMGLVEEAKSQLLTFISEYPRSEWMDMAKASLQKIT